MLTVKNTSESWSMAGLSPFNRDPIFVIRILGEERPLCITPEELEQLGYEVPKIDLAEDSFKALRALGIKVEVLVQTKVVTTYKVLPNKKEK